jgi:hypothetical protein
MPSAGEYSQMPVRVTRNAIYIGEERLPGCIAKEGVTIKPGGADDINRMTVEFLVGPVDVEDATT